MHGRGAVIGKAQDGGVEEGALGLLAAVDNLAAACLELLDGFRDVCLLIRRDQRAHGGGSIPRIAHDDLVAQACAEGFNGGVDKRMRDDGAADGRTLLAGLRGHFAKDRLDEGFELRGLCSDIGAQDGCVEGVRLRAELDAALDDVAVCTQGIRGVSGAGKRHVVAVIQVIQQIVSGAGDELQAALRKNSGIDHEAHAGCGDVAGGRSGLNNGRHARDESRGELFQHAPDGEVEGVDLHRDAGDGGVDVAANEGAVLGKDLRLTIRHDGAVGHLAAALRGEGEHGGNAAVDIDEIIALVSAGLVGQFVELFAVILEIDRQLLELEGALVEGELL